jgi:hypothetical protein
MADPIELQDSANALLLKINRMAVTAESMKVLAARYDRVTKLDMAGDITSVSIYVNAKRGQQIRMEIGANMQMELLRTVMEHYQREIERHYNDIQAVSKEI